MRKVELTTATSTLRPPVPADAEAIAAACQDPEIQRWVPIPVPYTLSDAISFVRDISDGGWARGSTCTWAIHAPQGFAGIVGLDHLTAGQATIGFWLAPEQRGREDDWVAGLLATDTTARRRPLR